MEKIKVTKKQKARLLNTLYGDIASEEVLGGYIDDPEYFGMPEGTTVRQVLLIALQPEELLEVTEDTQGE